MRSFVSSCASQKKSVITCRNLSHRANLQELRVSASANRLILTSLLRSFRSERRKERKRRTQRAHGRVREEKRRGVTEKSERSRERSHRVQTGSLPPPSPPPPTHSHRVIHWTLSTLVTALRASACACVPIDPAAVFPISNLHAPHWSPARVCPPCWPHPNEK